MITISSQFVGKAVGVFVLYLLAGSVVLAQAASDSYSSASSPEFYPNLGGDFVLEGTSGQMAFSEIKGHWKLLGFGFSHCPSICSMLLSKMNKVYQGLSVDSETFGAVFVSVDSDRDSGDEGIAQLQRFVSRFNDQFVALSGDKEQIAKVTKQYGVYYGQQKDTITHTDRIYLVNQEGRVKKLYSKSESIDTIVADLQKLLRD